MTIIHARVDERLIHGQVATVWTNSLGVNRIMVVNDFAVKDSIQIGALKMAKPVGVKLSILSKRKAIENIKNGKYDADKVFLITKNIEDMSDLVNADIGLTSFNIGNVSKKEGSKVIKKSVAINTEEEKIIRELIDKGIKITAQMLPSESSESILSFL